MAQETIKKAPSLSEYAYEEIKHAIERGVYPPGAKLITQEIADRLGISRTPVVAADRGGICGRSSPARNFREEIIGENDS